MGLQIGSIEINEEEKYRLISDFTYDWEEWRGPSNELLYVSPACERVTGYPAEAFLSDPDFIFSIIHPQDVPKFIQHRSELNCSQREESQLDFRIIHKSGEERWINHYCLPIFHQSGAWIGRRQSNRDITYRKRTEAQLFQTQQQLEIILSHIDTIVIGLNKDGQLVYANKAAANIAGFQSPSELIKLEIGQILDKFEIIDPDYKPLPLTQLSITEAINHIIESKLTIRFRRLGSDDYHWGILSGRPVFASDGSLDMLVVIVQDITKLKRTQSALQKSRDELEKRVNKRTKELELINFNLRREITTRKEIEAALQRERDFSLSLIQTAQIGLLVLDPHGKIIQINPFLEQISGYTLEEVYQKDWFEIFLFPEDKEGIKKMFYEALGEKPTRGITTHLRTKDGQIRLIEWHDRTLKDNHGDILGLLSIGQDVTDRKKIEERTLRHAAYAEALANISARINANLDLDVVLSNICEEMVHAIPAIKASAIMLVNSENQEVLSFAAGYGLVMEHQKQLNPVPISIYYDDLANYGTIRVTPNIFDLQAAPNLELAKRIDIRTVINAIMVHHDNIVGVIHLSTLHEPYMPSDEDFAFIQAFASHATVSIVNARLFQQISENRKRLQSLSQRLVKIQESERRIISRELHDEIGQELTSLILMLEVIKNTCHKHDTQSQAILKKLENAKELVNLILKQIRELAVDLRPGMLDDLGLLPALLMHFDRFTQQTDIKVIFKHSGIDQRFPGEIETTSFRIIQEALTNVARHAKVKQVHVRLWQDNQNLMIQIQDDGVGFNQEEILLKASSIGLLGMQERAALCDGRLEIESQPGYGTCLTVELPLNQKIQEDVHDLKNFIS